MNRTEHLLCILAEECSEVAKNASKAQRFGPEHIGPHAIVSNAALIVEEFADLCGVMEMLCDQSKEVAELFLDRYKMASMMIAKKEKVEKMMKFSRERGTLQD